MGTTLNQVAVVLSCFVTSASARKFQREIDPFVGYAGQRNVGKLIYR